MGLPLRRSPSPVLDVTVEPVAAIEAAAWDALARRAADPNPFYARRPVEAHRASGLGPADLAAVVVRDPDGLAALLPFVLRADITGLGAAVGQPFLSPYVTASTPLVLDGRDLEDRLDALVAGLALASGGRCWRWPMLAIESRLGAALVAAMERADWQVALVGRFARPVLDRRPDLAAFLADHPHKGRLKDLRRRRRRLDEAGALTFEVATDGAALERALDAFLALEAAGWKGEAGTALASRADSTRFAHALFRQDGATSGPPRVRADTLRLDGRVIAASLALVSGSTAYLLKTAYDETLRAHAPGLVLEDEIVRALHDTAFADRLDSATLPGSPLESLFPERMRIAEILALPPGGSLLPLERRADLARFEHRARAEVKRLMGRR
ncbi:GNAT family N-acetyltransferase [Methylorubrum salsuginis]|uniref:Acetyltransferase involved in cellulose biosynthesis, CelD/BcsL family n=1 Tax=Methylorubrum salsuginis TaxID=414703 RepID=A0A1I4CKP8_9HYPH|nr:GNAT family N-acetyltransferase [Methylorubrum salsuginis]SFK80859.1 Acetyltransferase involved in cellulose biosynthesis, CelD/BcsL family [Methylorubrum salsuginis]